MNELTTTAFLLQLLAPFYPQAEELGRFKRLAAGQMPPHYSRLLEHDGHMTVTLEQFHAGPVELQVLRSEQNQGNYLRKIALRRAGDRAVVLFGVVRLNLPLLPPAVAAEIQDESKPLGRVLIEHQVLREVERLDSWRVEPGPELAVLFAVPTSEPLYGRTAIIHCNGEPAIELLEIVHVPPSVSQA